MANQYKNSFKSNLEKLYKKPVDVCLKNFVDEGLTYIEVAKLTGVQATTVKKWCRRHNLKLKGVIEIRDQRKKQEQLAMYWSQFRSKKLNHFNFLSKSWR